MTRRRSWAPGGSPADAGSAAAPLAVSLITALASVAIASGVMGVFGLLGRRHPAPLSAAGTCRGGHARAESEATI